MYPITCSKRPNLCQYEGQAYPCRAYLDINTDGSVDTGYCSNDNAVPAWVFNRSILRFNIDCRLINSKIESLIAEIVPLAKILHEQFPVEWDDSKMTRGRMAGLYALEEEIQIVCDQYVDDDDYSCDDACDFCNPQEGGDDEI